MGDGMITALWIAAALILLLYVIPVGIVTFCLFSRKNPRDYDQNPQRLDDGNYAPWKDQILRDMAWMRRKSSREVSVRAPDGTILKGDWYDGGGDRTVILAHGFGSTALNNFSTIAKAFLENGWNALLLCQRAHGKSGGRATTLGMREGQDLACWALWAEKNTPTRKAVLYGISMGGASVARAAGEKLPKSVGALVIDCGFYLPYRQMLDSRQGGKNLLWQVIMPLIRLYVLVFLRLDLKRDAREFLRRSPVPVYFLHGEKDKTVPAAGAREAYAACGSRKEISIVAGAPHTLAFLAGGEEEKKKLFAFLNTCL